MRRIEADRIERMARLCANNIEAGASLGIHPRSFSRACTRYGIETPYARRQRLRREFKDQRR